MEGPEGRHLFGLVKVGEKGQIVIPKEARDLYGIKPGDQLLVGGDPVGLGIFSPSSPAFKQLFQVFSVGEGDKK